MRIAIEMHANQLVYSVPGLLRLRETVGSTVGANMDPSHLLWMGRTRSPRSRVWSTPPTT